LRAITRTAFAVAALAALPVAAQDDQAQNDQAQNGQAQNDPVVARVDGHEITRSDVEREVSSLPEQYRQMPFEQLFDTLRDRAINTALLSSAAKERDLADEPAVQEAIDEAVRLILRNRLIETTVDEAVSEEALRAAYEARADEPGFSQQEAKARHILVESRDEAVELIARLDDGADFQALAEEHSTGPSGENGGDLGWFTREQMVGPFGEAVFAMEPGEISSEPVETRFGWHVIELEDRRTTTPSFEESRAELEQEIGREAVTALLEDLRESASIERFDLEGEPLETAE